MFKRILCSLQICSLYQRTKINKHRHCDYQGAHNFSSYIFSALYLISSPLTEIWKVINAHLLHYTNWKWYNFKFDILLMFSLLLVELICTIYLNKTASAENIKVSATVSSGLDYLNWRNSVRKISVFILFLIVSCCPLFVMQRKNYY